MFFFVNKPDHIVLPKFWNSIVFFIFISRIGRASVGVAQCLFFVSCVSNPILEGGAFLRRPTRPGQAVPGAHRPGRPVGGRHLQRPLHQARPQQGKRPASTLSTIDTLPLSVPRCAAATEDGAGVDLSLVIGSADRILGATTAANTIGYFSVALRADEPLSIEDLSCKPNISKFCPQSNSKLPSISPSISMPKFDLVFFFFIVSSFSIRRPSSTGSDLIFCSPFLASQLTTYTALMDVTSGRLDAWLRYCPEPCQPW